MRATPETIHEACKRPDRNTPTLLLRMRAQVAGQIDPAELSIIRVMHDTEHRNRGPSPQIRMVVHRHHVVTLARTVRDAGLDLERNAQRRDAASIGEVDVCVFADVLLLVNLLKPASMVLEEQPRRVDAIPAGDAG
jgi:hypothetical protein